MCRNNKNARLQKAEDALPKNRSAAARARAASGETRRQGRATAPKHGKKNAWWQRVPKITYAQFIKGGAKSGKRAPKQEEAAEVAE